MPLRKVGMANKGFTQVPNDIYNSTDISFKAKGLWGFIKSKPVGWRFSAKRIARQSKDGNESVASGLHELEEKGYLIRTPAKNEDGLWGGYDYYLMEKPFTHNAVTVNPLTKNLLNNSKKDVSDKEYSKKEGEGKAHSPSKTKKANKKKNVKYSDVIKICEPHLKGVSLEFGVSIHDVRGVLQQMASHYVAEGRSFPNWVAKLANWVVIDLKEGKIEIDPSVVGEARRIKKINKMRALIASTLGENWSNNKDLLKEVDDYLSSNQGYEAPLNEVKNHLETLKSNMSAVENNK